MESHFVCIRKVADRELIQNCKRNLDASLNKMHLLSKSLNLEDDEIRLKLLFLLYKERKLCVCDLEDILGFPKSTLLCTITEMKKDSIIFESFNKQTIFYSLERQYRRLIEPLFK